MTDPSDRDGDVSDHDGDASDAQSVDPDAAFGALSDPTRVDIVRALALHRREHPDDPGLAFAELRKQVDVRDSGRFLYHLEKLQDHFVEKTPDGEYRLDFAGAQVATAILSGLFTDRVRLGPTDLDAPCRICDSTAVGVYEAGQLAVTCENDHSLLRWHFPPNAARDAAVPELARLATTEIRQQVESALLGSCGACYGQMDTRAERAEGKPVSPRFRARCETCGTRLDGPLWFALLAYPEVFAFYRRHGWSVRETYLWEFEGEPREDPFPGEAEPDHHLAITLGDQRLHAAVDASAHVVETTVRDVE